jgi:pimeloyl-ACP methyl ester carboxylesterase
MSAPDLEVLERLPTVDVGKPPLLFVHGLGHGAWAFENWLDAAVKAGYPAYAVSLRGHGGSPGRLRSSMLGHYVDDVVRTASALPRPAVLVGHSLGGLVVQRALARYAAHAGVLVTPVSSSSAIVDYLNIARRHPLDALKMAAGITLPLRPDYLFVELDPAQAQTYADRCGKESPLAQYQTLFHLAAKPPLGGAPVLVLAAPDERLLMMRGMRKTAAHYGAPLREFPGMGHDMMLEPRWREPLQAMLGWLAELPEASAQPTR